MAFRQDTGGKAVFLSVDSRHIPHNPLYKAWKASGFTKNDISLHFLLLDILADGVPRSIPALLNTIDADYLPFFQNAEPLEESTLRKKLKEYVALGLIIAEKQGKQLIYRLPASNVNLAAWQDALSFFAEENPLGVVGSYLLDKFEAEPAVFSFKHRYLLFALDSGILLDLLCAIREKRKAELALVGGRSGRASRCVMLPLKIYSSVQGGRQYLAAYSPRQKKLCFFRIDSIQKVKPLELIEDYDSYQEYLNGEQACIWGVSTGQGKREHIEMTLKIVAKDRHITQRLEREKRCGTVEQLSATEWRFFADVYDAQELLPWLRTFIGRISVLTCSNKRVERQFWADISSLSAMYGGDKNAL